jgi:hypothetical protein
MAVAKAVTSGFAIGDPDGATGGTGNFVITMQVSVEPK